MDEISVFDNLFSKNEYTAILNWCLNASYQYGEKDDDHLSPTGMICNINSNEDIYNFFIDKISEICPELKNIFPYRVYVNCFASSENPHFHRDSIDPGLTFLYYVDTLKWKPDDGGETQFLIDDNIYGIIPIANRLCRFDSRLLHRATAFRDRHRFTVALKYNLTN